MLVSHLSAPFPRLESTSAQQCSDLEACHDNAPCAGASVGCVRCHKAACARAVVPLKDNGLERSAAAQEDIDWLVANKGATHPEHKPEGPGATYVELLQRLAADDVPSFMCHFYNFTFAHTAGGRMIGKAVSNAILDGAELSFYKYEGDPSAMADALKEKIEAAAQTWSEEERKRSVAQTPQTFEYSGKLLRCITLESDDDELLGGGGAGQGGEKEMAVAA